MADKKISALDSASSVSGTDVVPIVQSSTNKKSTLQVISDWIIQTALSFTQSGSGESRTVQGKLRDVLSILDFVPSSLHAGIMAGTNTTTLQTYYDNAVAALPSAGGAIFFPGIGPYILKLKMPDYPKKLSCIGDGNDITILQPAATNTPAIEGADTVVSGHAHSRHFIWGFTLKAHASGSTGAAMDLRKFSFSKVQNISFALNGAGAWTYGALLDATDHCYSNVLDDFNLKNTSPISSAVVRFATTANLHFLTNFRITASTLTNVISIANSGGNHIVIRDGHFEGLTCTNVIDPGNSNVNIIVDNCYFENVVDAFNRSATSDVSILNPYFAPTPGASLAGALPANFQIFGGNISGGTNARNRIRGRLIINGANSEDGAVHINNSANTSAVLVSHDGTDLQINFPVDTSESYKVDNVKVVGNRDTGWTTSSGTGNKNASGINVDTITASDANIRALGAWVKALHDALTTHGMIGS